MWKVAIGYGNCVGEATPNKLHDFNRNFRGNA